MNFNSNLTLPWHKCDVDALSLKTVTCSAKDGAAMNGK